MVAKPLCPLYKNIIKPLDRARYPELRYICIGVYMNTHSKAVKCRKRDPIILLESIIIVIYANWLIVIFANLKEIMYLCKKKVDYD